MTTKENWNSNMRDMWDDEYNCKVSAIQKEMGLS